MKVGWLLDETVFDTYHDELADAIRRNGFEVQSANRPNPPWRWDDTGSAYRDAFPRGSCVITHADIELVTRVLSDGCWLPGAFATVANFYCSHYYPYVREYLLNRDYEILPFAELAQRKSELFERFGPGGRMFVRPDSPLKLFTGLVASHEQFEKDLEFMAFYEFPTDSPVVVSSPKSITREWRFVIVDQKVVGASQYKEGDSLIALPGADAAALTLAEAVLNTGFAPDPAWVMDVCETSDGDFHLLELGGFSFSNLYGCDKEAVVRAVSSAANRVYEEQPRS